MEIFVLDGGCPVSGKIIYSQKINTLFSEKRRVLEELMEIIGDRFADDSDEEFRLKLSIDEGIQNAFSHGNKCDPDKIIKIDLFEADTSWGILVTDEGEGFYANHINDPTSPEHIMKENGRGLLIMKQYMDRISYYNSGRTLRLLKKKDQKTQ